MMTRDQIIAAGMRASEVVNGFKMPTQQNARDAARLAETAIELLRTVDMMQRKIDELSERRPATGGIADAFRAAGIF